MAEKEERNYKSEEELKKETNKILEQLASIERTKRKQENKKQETQTYAAKLDVPSLTSKIGEAINKTIKRSKGNLQKIKDVKRSLVSLNRLKEQIEEKLGEFHKKLGATRKKLMQLKKQSGKTDSILQTTEKNKTKIKKIEKEQEEIQTLLQQYKKELKEHEVHLQNLREKVVKEKFKELQEDFHHFKEETARKKDLKEQEKDLEELQRKIEELTTHLQEEPTFLLNFPTGTISLSISRDETVAELLKKIKERMEKETDIPPKVRQKLTLGVELRGISVRYNGQQLTASNNKKIGALIGEEQVPTLQVRPYWEREDLGGNISATVNYENGDQTTLTVPPELTIETLKEEIKGRIKATGEGLKPKAKNRWEENKKNNERGEIANFEIFGNGKRIKDLHSTVGELQMDGSVEFMVSFTYL